MATVFAYEDLVARWADTPREVGEGDRRPADLWIQAPDHGPRTRGRTRVVESGRDHERHRA